MTNPGVLLCRPVDISAMPDGIPIPDVYPGSVEDTCFGCDRRVWVGPTQQAKRRESPELRLGCYICLFAAMDAGVRPSSIQVLSDTRVPTHYKDGRPGD